ncbi:MAG: aminotransferase class I/II-fold pyridoxal phosphate-dependent enzyme [Cyanophyceae cyanobacterium]
MNQDSKLVDPYSWIERSLTTIHKANWYRSPQALEGLPGPVMLLDGEAVLNFASNDYLGLAGDRELIEMTLAAVEQWGTGSTGSRLITGHRDIHRALEREIAALKNTEGAIVYSSGYGANIGVLSAIVGPKDLLVGDAYNHSSLISGCKISGASFQPYDHGNMVALRDILTAQRSHFRRCAIVTDSVFSMDGDLCPLGEILAIAEEFEAMVVIDEAHATGVLGATGAGVVEFLGFTGQPMIQVGPLSKALASLGGYVAGSAALVDFLRNRSASWIYSTALSPADTAAALAAIDRVKAEPERRDRLSSIANYLREGLWRVVGPWGDRGFRLLPSDTPIICLQVPDTATVLTLGEQLRAGGIFAGAIRPPTVHTSRLRFTVRADHSRAHCDAVLEVLEKALKTLG